MSGNITYVFPGNNSAEGFFSFYHSGLQGMKKIYILKGGPGTGKSTLMRNIGLTLAERGYDIEFWQCSSDNQSLDGVLIPALKGAVIDGTAPHVVDPLYPGAVEEIINLGEFWDSAILRQHVDEICDLTDQIGKTFREAYKKLAAAGDRERERLARHDRQSDRDVIYKTAEEVMTALFAGHESYIRHLFAAAITPEGPVDYRFDITDKVKRRFFLAGPAGEGRQHILSAIVERAEKKQLAADVYHDGLLPENLSMVVLPELDVAVVAVDEAPPITRQEDTVIALSITAGNGEGDVIAARDELINEGAALIMESHLLHDKLEVFYRKATDFKAVGAIQDRLIKKLLK